MMSTHPPCFEGREQYRGWYDEARKTREEGSPCDDCTVEYKARMTIEGRCKPDMVRAMFTVNRRK